MQFPHSFISGNIGLMIQTYHVVIVLVISAAIDYLIGDPWGWPHPVQAMGWAIRHLSQFILNSLDSPQGDQAVVAVRVGGIFLGIILIFGSGTLSWLLIKATNWVHPLLGMIIESILLASCFALRSLRDAARDVLHPFQEGDLIKARQSLSLYVGRDTDNLSESDILRAILETVTENATDGVMAPLFYAMFGATLSFSFDILGWVNDGTVPNGFSLSLMVPFCIAYKASSTLDSMVGYKELPYLYLGWFSAKLEDILTWVPCRLTVITLACLSRQPLYVWQICQRDAVKDPSPNSGWSECAYCAVLGVQLGGINYYRGVIKEKPLLGEPLHPITPEVIEKALQLTRACFLIWLGLFVMMSLLLELIPS